MQNNLYPPTSTHAFIPLTSRIILLFLGLVLSFPGDCQALEKVSVCIGSASSSLLPIALEQGYFRAEGVEMELRPFTSGKNSMQAMLDGKCDLATTAQTPIVNHSMTRRDFLVVANLSLSDDFEKIVVRADRGILKATDLKGRRIALPEFTTQHYLLDTFLAYHGFKNTEVQRLYLHHNEVIKAFQRGEVDAVVHREPETTQLVEEFGGKARVMPSKGLCVAIYALVGKRDFVQNNPATMVKVLRALLRAEEFAKKEPSRAKAIAAKTYKADQAQIEQIWAAHTFHVSINQPLLFLLENMARWQIGLLPAAQRKPLPNYLDFLYLDALKLVKPEAVTVIY